jgi:hypothetical protein
LHGLSQCKALKNEYIKAKKPKTVRKNTKKKKERKNMHDFAVKVRKKFQMLHKQTFAGHFTQHITFIILILKVQNTFPNNF